MLFLQVMIVFFKSATAVGCMRLRVLARISFDIVQLALGTFCWVSWAVTPRKERGERVTVEF